MITNKFFTELTKITDGEICFSASKSGIVFSVMSDTCPLVWSGVITAAGVEFLDDTSEATLQAHVDGTPEGYNPAIFQTLVDLSHLYKVRVLSCVLDGTLHVTFFGDDMHVSTEVKEGEFASISDFVTDRAFPSIFVENIARACGFEAVIGDGVIRFRKYD
ncbi:hypothetical protein KC887_08610 [Candidatus Kaiserbacteria bacterium]|nr:hypothetical protein [Candidatus Kaiserbacteria bacterium]